MSTAEITEAPTAARAAALWWAQQVGAPVFRNTGPRDSAEDQFNGGIAGVMASMLADRHPVTKEQGAKFADELENGITETLGWNMHGATLSVDYGPGPELAKPAEAAGIDLSRFPWKTTMWVHHDHVTASLGYGAQSALVWQAPDWVRPPCGSQRYIDLPGGDYECRDEVCSLPRYHEGDHDNWVPDPARCKECGGTYTGHHGLRDADGERVYLDHSWHPAVAS